VGGIELQVRRPSVVGIDAILDLPAMSTDLSKAADPDFIGLDPDVEVCELLIERGSYLLFRRCHLNLTRGLLIVVRAGQSRQRSRGPKEFGGVFPVFESRPDQFPQQVVAPEDQPSDRPRD